MKLNVRLFTVTNAHCIGYSVQMRKRKTRKMMGGYFHRLDVTVLNGWGGKGKMQPRRFFFPLKVFVLDTLVRNN